MVNFPSIESILLLLCAVSNRRLLVSSVDDKSEWKGVVNDQSQSELFEPSDQIRAFSPSRFPKPTWMLGDNATVVVEPTFGKHRPDQDAVFAYAEGFKLPYYMSFMETLTETGFTGDVVLAIAETRIVAPDVEDYLRTFVHHGADERGDGALSDRPAVVVYQVPLECDGEPGNRRRVLPMGFTDTFQMCRLSHVYGWKDAGTGDVLSTARDPRDSRVVATIRYEWYWIWNQRYDPHSWILLLDSRDSFFQSNPFNGLPRETDPTRPDGLLYLYGENPDATRLGKSRKNLKWLQNGYGQGVIDALKDKPTICSGSTMGEQIALDTYLRAMVNEHDECNIKMTGSDQGFHNYLYYSSKLRNAEPIRRIVVWEQGRGAINNLGALRIKTLEEWGMYNPETHRVYQWDGQTLSPVVHQWDRDKHLHSFMINRKFNQWKFEWNKRKEATTRA